jgi:taurine--2-oxoglutarate transaminase
MTTPYRTRQEILDLSRETTLYEWTSQKAIKPMVIDRAEGIYMWDVDGKRYMDFNSQLMCVNIGHGDQRVIDAITAQLKQIAYVAPTAATTAGAQRQTNKTGGPTQQRRGLPADGAGLRW